MGWEVEGRFKREETYVYLWLIHVDTILQLKNKFQKREETYVYLVLIHVGLWQKPTQHCKAVILQLKINLKKKKKINKNHPICIILSKVKVLVAQSCPTLCDPMNCCLPGSSVHGILQARILEWDAIPFSKGSSQPRD